MSEEEREDDHQLKKEGTPSEQLSDKEVEEVAERKASSPRVVHEVIRLQGHEEMRRPLLSLIFSAFAGGLAISASLLAEAFLHMRLPDTPAAELLTDLGYTAGFVIVILGNLQLFTETTVSAVLPIATHPRWENIWRLGRLWAAVFGGNMLGTLFTAFLMSRHLTVSVEQLDSALTLSAKLLQHDWMTTLLFGVPAGFLIASIAWILPSLESGEFWVIVMVTYLISLGGFSHVVAGSAEAWLLWLSGKASLGWALGGFILPALLGNIIGGTGLFAVLAHGQVRGEL